MTMWLHIIAVIAIVIYSITRFIKEKRAFHIMISLWALSTLLNYAPVSPAFLKGLGIAQIAMFIIVVFLMFRRRGERRMNTLELLSKMAADNLPDDEPTPASDNKDKTVVEIVPKNEDTPSL